MSNRLQSVIDELYDQFNADIGLLRCGTAFDTKFRALFDVLRAKYEVISALDHCNGPMSKHRPYGLDRLFTCS